MVENLVTKPICMVEPTYVLGGKTLTEYGEKEKMIRMLANENPLGISPMAADAMAKAAKETGNIYPDSNAAELKKKLADFLHFGAYGLDGQNLSVTMGAEHALNMIMEIFVEQGDEVLVSSPSYRGYNRTIARAGGVKKTVPFLESGGIDFEGLLNAITEKTKVVIVCNPNNPTGSYEPKESVKKFIGEFPRNKLLILDEAYIHFAPNGLEDSLYTEVSENVNLLIVHTFSKIYGMAGIRVGYIITNKEISGYIRRYGGIRMSNVQLAGAMAALDDKDFYETSRRLVAEGRAYLIKQLEELGYEPYESAANFVFCDLKMEPGKLDAEMIKRGILIRTNLEYPRISVGTMEQNRLFIKALKEIKEQEEGKG